jgi:oligopeptide transport system permease protein
VLSFILRRFVSAIPTLFLIITISFFLIRLAPGGPFDLERPLEAKVMDNLNRIYKLDRPLVEQYLLYLGALARGDFGPSFIMRDFTVAELFARGLPISMTLGALALLVAILVGGTLGAIAAFRQNSAVDYLVTGLGTFGLTIPTFVIAPVLQIVFGLTLSLLPVAGWTGSWRNLVLPVITLSLPQIAVVARMTRAAMIENLRSNHIRTLKSLGLPNRVVVRHALRGAALPVVSYLGPAAAALLTGSVVVETIFAVPGIGRYFVEAALNRDYTLVMGTVAVIDPRVRYD